MELDIQFIATHQALTLTDEIDQFWLRDVIANGSLSFDDWTSLISHVENKCPDGDEKLWLVYDSFLAEFPLCHGYWGKYADHKLRLGNVDDAIEVFERAVDSAAYSVGLWADYCQLGISVFEDPDDVRRLFRRSLSFVGKDYLSHSLWDKYIAFEFSQRQWISLAQIYIQALRYPTKKLHQYYDRFMKLIAIWEEEMDFQGTVISDMTPESTVADKDPTFYKDQEISNVVRDMLDSSDSSGRYKALQQYTTIGKKIYEASCPFEEKIRLFETNTRRSYFHVMQLDNSQLENWHNYLDFAENLEDFDWAVKIYEKCLIPCANYPEFWMRYVEFMESNGGRELAVFALERATRTFLKRMPIIHVYNARFKEQIGDVLGARAALAQFSTDSSISLVESVIVKANMEKRWGNFTAASDIYEEAIAVAISEKKLDSLPSLCTHYCQHLFMTTQSADAAIDVLIKGIKHVPHCTLLYEELVKFAMLHGGSQHKNSIDRVIADVLSLHPDEFQVLSERDKEYISNLYIKFIDLCGEIHDVRKAWNQHIRMFPQSLRTKHIDPTICAQSLKTTMEGKKASRITKHVRASQDYGSDELQEKVSELEIVGIQCEKAKSDEKSPLLEVPTSQAGGSISQLKSGLVGSTAEEPAQMASFGDLEQPRVISYEPNGLSFNLTASEASDETESVVAAAHKGSQGNKLEGKEVCDEEKMPILCKELIDPMNDRPSSSTPIASHASECREELPVTGISLAEGNVREISMPSENLPESVHLLPGDGGTSSQRWDQAYDDYMRKQRHRVSPSKVSSGSHISRQLISWHQEPNSGRSWHRMNNLDRREDTRFRSREHLRKKSERQRPFLPRNEKDPSRSMIPRQRQFSAQNRQIPPVAKNQFQTPPAQGNPTSSTMPMPNVLPENSGLGGLPQMHSQPVVHPQAQVSQYPFPSAEQYGLVQNHEACNQMWQYYYQQHQYNQQQQQLQLQQPELSQGLQSQPQQQLQQQQQQLSYEQLQMQYQQYYLQQQQLLLQQSYAGRQNPQQLYAYYTQQQSQQQVQQPLQQSQLPMQHIQLNPLPEQKQTQEPQQEQQQKEQPQKSEKYDNELEELGPL